MTISNEELEKIIFPENTKRIGELQGDNDLDLVYYTDLQTMHKILTGKEIWMRNVTCMNDYSEVRHGVRLVREYLYGNEKVNLKRLLSLLNSIDEAHLINWESELLNPLEREIWFEENTFITCVSEFNAKKNKSGKLSMWRAYGRGNGAALVINKNVLLSNVVKNKYRDIVLSAVTYSNEDKFNHLFDVVLNNIEQKILKSKPLDKCFLDKLLYCLINALIFSFVSVKNPGFEEEQEWRLIYFKSNHQCSKSGLECKVEIINNIPQLVYKIKLNETVLPDIIKKIIIGPTKFPIATRAAIVEDVKQLFNNNDTPGVNYDNLIYFSEIPIRPDCV